MLFHWQNIHLQKKMEAEAKKGLEAVEKAAAEVEKVRLQKCWMLFPDMQIRFHS
jgi:hypothetical protein